MSSKKSLIRTLSALQAMGLKLAVVGHQYRGEIIAQTNNSHRLVSGLGSVVDLEPSSNDDGSDIASLIDKLFGERLLEESEFLGEELDSLPDESVALSGYGRTWLYPDSELMLVNPKETIKGGYLETDMSFHLCFNWHARIIKT